MLERKDDRRSVGLGPPGSVHDLLKLYNLALAIRGTGDPHTVCVDFVSETVRVLKLSYGAVWLIEPGVRLEAGDFVLFASYPRARDGQDRVTSDHAMPRMMAKGEPVRISSEQPEFPNVTVEPSIKSGVQVLFRLDGVGLLKLYCSDADALPNAELNRLRPVIDRFADALRAAFATRRLRQEINQRRQAEGKLTRARILSQTLLTFSPDVIFHKDLDGRYIEGNTAFRKLWNLGERQILGLRPEEFISPQTLQGIKQQDRQIVDSGEAKFFQEEVELDNGRTAYMEVTRAPVYDASGRISGIIGIARDATERRATVAKLETRNRALESITDGVVIATTNTDLSIVYANDAFSEMAGRSQEDLIGSHSRDVGLLDLDDILRTQIRTAINNHEPYFLKVNQRRPSGAPFACEISLAPVLDSQGQSTHYIGIIKNVTESERLRRELAQRQKMDTVGRLTSGIAHDFNNMLATILGFSELAELRAEDAGDEQLIEFMECIRNAADSGRELVSQLLTFARSVPAAKPQVINANQAISNALKMVRPLLPEAIELNYTCSEPGADLAIDAMSLERLVVNLCLNARDAMGNNGTLQITLTIEDLSDRECAVSLTQLNGNYVTLSVSDTGRGIPDDILGRVFEPFFTTKRPTQGTGMGLSVVQGIVRAHNGFILVETAVGRGTTFTAAFPQAYQPAEALQKTITTPQRAATLEGRSILVVDDDRQVAAFLRELFEHAGMTVEVAYDGTSGLQKFAESRDSLDILITDQTMPGMTGIELIREVRALRPQIPCVMLTAYSHFAESSSASAAGIDRLLRKPTDNKTLLRTVAELL